MSKKKVQYISPDDLHEASLLELAQLPNEALILHLSARHLKVKGKKKARVERLFKAMHGESHKPLFRERPSARKIKDKRTEVTTQTPEPKRKRSNAKQQEATPKKKAPKIQLPTKVKIEQLIQCGGHQQPVEQLTTKKDATVNSSHSKKTTKPIGPMCIVSQPVVTQPVVTQQSPVVRTEHRTNPLPNHVYVTAPPQLSTTQSASLTFPITLEERIARGDYIDFTQLLPSFPYFTHFPYYRNDIPVYPTMNHTPAEITSFAEWMQAWNIYVALVIAHAPHRALELIGYQKIITSASSQYPVYRWMAYDTQFRILAAVDRSLRWDVHHPDTWFRCMGLPPLPQHNRINGPPYLPPLQPVPRSIPFQAVVPPRRGSTPCHGSHRRYYHY